METNFYCTASYYYKNSDKLHGRNYENVVLIWWKWKQKRPTKQTNKRKQQQQETKKQTQPKQNKHKTKKNILYIYFKKRPHKSTATKLHRYYYDQMHLPNKKYQV